MLTTLSGHGKHIEYSLCQLSMHIHTSYVSLSHHCFCMQISCFTNACNYDGCHDCCPNVDTSDPFRCCLEHDHCRDRYSNGYCDHECNNARCLYDGPDCVAPPSTCSHLYVASSFHFLARSYLVALYCISWAQAHLLIFSLPESRVILWPTITCVIETAALLSVQ